MNERIELHRLIDRLPEAILSEVKQIIEVLLSKRPPSPNLSSVPPTAGDDPVMAIIGAYASEEPLIDNIPVSEDPTLYWVAESLGDQAKGLHAWEILPRRYQRGTNGQPIRRDVDEG